MRSGTVPPGGPVSTQPAGWTRNKWFRRFVVGSCFVVVLYAISPFLLGCVGRWLNVGEELDVPVDYVYVLGGEASTRPFLAAAIFRAGFARKVLIPEGQPPTAADEWQMSEHQVQRAVLLHRGVPDRAILELPGPVDSTSDEAVALAKFLESNPQATVAVVTSNFHTRRTRLMFRRILPKHRDHLRFVACPTDGFGPENWWHYRDGVLWYTAEYAKLLREMLRGL